MKNLFVKIRNYVFQLFTRKPPPPSAFKRIRTLAERMPDSGDLICTVDSELFEELLTESEGARTMKLEKDNVKIHYHIDKVNFFYSRGKVTIMNSKKSRIVFE